MYKSLLVVSLFSLSASAMTGNEVIRINRPLASHKLGKVDLYHNNGEFQIMQNNKLHVVENHCVDKPLRNIDKQKLAAFLANGHLAINKTDSGEFTIRGNQHLNGGGPVLGVITAVVGTVTTGIAATATFIVCIPSGPGAGLAAAAVAHAGMAATGYATIAATAAPTP